MVLIPIVTNVMPENLHIAAIAAFLDEFTLHSLFEIL